MGHADKPVRASRLSRHPGIAALVSAAGVAVVFAVTACSSRSGIPRPGPAIGQSTNALLPAAVTRTVLINSAGQPMSLGNLGDRVLVVSDMMSLCTQTCPLDTANVVAAARAVERAGLGDRVAFLSITIDPGRDTVAQLAAYRALYKPAPPDWYLLTGSGGAIDALWRSFGVFIQRVRDKPPLPTNWRTGQPLTYDLDHSDELFFIDTNDRERFVLEGAPHVAPAAPMPPTLVRFLDATGHKNLTHPDPQAWTLPQELDVISWLLDRRIAAAAG